ALARHEPFPNDRACDDAALSGRRSPGAGKLAGSGWIHGRWHLAGQWWHGVLLRRRPAHHRALRSARPAAERRRVTTEPANVAGTPSPACSSLEARVGPCAVVQLVRERSRLRGGQGVPTV